MTKGKVLVHYRNVSNEDRGTFDRWMKVNLIAGALFFAALVGMAVPAAYAPGPRSALAQATASVPMPR
jgi:hypothetical protein